MVVTSAYRNYFSNAPKPLGPLGSGPFYVLAHHSEGFNLGPSAQWPWENLGLGAGGEGLTMGLWPLGSTKIILAMLPGPWGP